MIDKDDKTTEGGPSKSKKSPAKPTKGHKLGSQTQGITINDHGLSSTRLIQAAEMISKPMLNTAAGPPWGLPTKYFHYGKKLSAYKDTRNHGAHRSEGIPIYTTSGEAFSNGCSTKVSRTWPQRILREPKQK
ncbi:MAG: hypothetical protein Q9228_007553 [Teloschistes exilis]